MNDKPRPLSLSMKKNFIIKKHRGRGKFIITIDGPAGAGKTTIAKMVAEQLKFKYIDTGAMYRAITLKVIENEIPFSHITEIEELTENTDISMNFLNSEMIIFLDGRDVSSEIRCPAVTDNTSLVAAIEGVRNKLRDIQREISKKIPQSVFEGRDMGSVVFPGADIKVYLDAGINVRARRRWTEFKNKGIEISLKELEEKIKKRDKLDEERGLAPLKVPDGAYIIDSTDMTITEVVQKIIALLDR